MFTELALVINIFSSPTDLWERVGQSTTTGQAATSIQPTPLAAVPLSILSSQIDGRQQTVTFTLQNTGTKTITAWEVAIVAGTEPDARYGGYGVDSFRSFAGLSQGGSALVPGSTAVVTAPLPSRSNALNPVVILPRVAIFADTSFIGDDRFAQLIFDGRAAQLAAWRDILHLLEGARNKGIVDSTSLESILAGVNATILRDGPDIVHQTFRANLSQALSNVRTGKEPAASALTRFLDEARQNVAAAAAHSRQ
jgi:hypothetical protein